MSAVSFLSYGGQYSLVTENSVVSNEQVESIFHTSGLYLSYYNFSQHELGFFIHSSLLALIEGKTITKDSIDYYHFRNSFNDGYFSLLSGIAIIEWLSYDSNFYFGIGPSTHLFFLGANNNPFLNFMFGFGFSMGYNYFITPNFYLDSGTIIDYNFLSYYKNPNSSKWVKEDNYGMYTIRYYIGFGLF